MVFSADFSYRKSANHVFRGEAELTPIVANRKYQLPEVAVPKSIIVYLSGQALNWGVGNDVTWVPPDIFELAETLNPSIHILTVSYSKA